MAEKKRAKDRKPSEPGREATKDNPRTGDAGESCIDGIVEAATPEKHNFKPLSEVEPPWRMPYANPDVTYDSGVSHERHYKPLSQVEGSGISVYSLMDADMAILILP